MLNLETTLRLDAEVPRAKNLCHRFTDDDLARIGNWVWEGYVKDYTSRDAWARRNQAAMDLALQLQKAKSFPWPDAANVAFPLITIGAMQFHARAYPALCSGPQIVKCRVPGPDAQGAAAERAKRVGEFMSYQVLEEDTGWEEGQDRLLIQLPIVGSVFKKTQYKASIQQNSSETVSAFNLVLDYYAKSVESCTRKTHITPLYRNDVHERCMSGVWRDVTEEPWYLTNAQPYREPGSAEKDTRTGQQPPQADEATPITFLEQHCWVDLDKDGYAEPYIVTIDGNSKNVVRIVARWEELADVERNGSGRVIRIRATEYFTKYELIPSPDGGVYGLGFGILLGPLNESVNSIVNQLLDAGTMANAAGGFLARGAKIRGGTMSFSPFQWNRVDATGEDLQKSMMPLPVREPSAVLFNLLSFLVNYTQRISGSTDATVGENPGQNTPAATQQSMIEQGQKIYTALFKRCWRSMREEFKKLYILNARFLPLSRSFGETGMISREDFLGDPSRICPAADPNITSDQVRVQMAAGVAERSMAVPGYNKDAVERNLLTAMRVEGIDVLFPGSKAMPAGESEKITIAKLKLQGEMSVESERLNYEKMVALFEAVQQQRMDEALIAKLQAEVVLLTAQSDAESTGKQVAILNSMIGMVKARDDALRNRIELMLRGLELSQEAEIEGVHPGGTGKLVAGPSNEGVPAVLPSPTGIA